MPGDTRANVAWWVVLSRRGFLLGTSAAALAAACGADDDVDATNDTTNGSTTTPGGAGAIPLVLGEAFDRNGLLVAGIEQRAPFLLFEQTGGLVALADAPATIEFTLTPDGGTALAPLEVARHGSDIDRPYYPLLATFPTTGVWNVTADLGDGTMLTSSIGVNAGPTVPQVGDPLPLTPTPTVADPLGVATICTREPACPFHSVSLDAASSAAGPVAVLISTPAFCQVGICGPVLDLLIAAAAPTDPPPTIIHVEVYPNGPPDEESSLSPVVTDTFALTYEPVLFVARGGIVTARLDNIYDGAELAEALASGA